MWLNSLQDYLESSNLASPMFVSPLYFKPNYGFFICFLCLSNLFQQKMVLLDWDDCMHGITLLFYCFESSQLAVKEDTWMTYHLF
jgi:hypothetical protein